MNKRNWGICYSGNKGPEKRALEFIYREVGKYILRDPEIYMHFVMPCVHVAELNGELPESNVIVLGTLKDNGLLQTFIKKEEVPEHGYIIKAIAHPKNPEWKAIFICGDGPKEVFYGAVDFVDDYLVKAEYVCEDANIHLQKENFLHPLPNANISAAPDFETRSVFTWGHPINDYRAYIEDLARLKLNQVIIWNDFLPINADDIVEYAHSFGMEVIWGYAWGWGFDCTKENIQALDVLSEEILREYHRTYQGKNWDGIYFQSFTEGPEYIDGIRVSEAVVELVNKTAGALLAENPNLRILFGLHAQSVKKYLDDIAKVDKRLEIIWEDCGSFPYKCCVGGFTDDNMEKWEVTDNILSLREDGKNGFVYKCQLTMEWSRGRVAHQPGPYVMGKMADEIIKHDEEILIPAWRAYSVKWLKHGEEAHRLTQKIYGSSKGKVNMCLAGMFSGGIWFPTALCAQMFWDCKESYEEIQRKVLSRGWIRF